MSNCPAFTDDQIRTFVLALHGAGESTSYYNCLDHGLICKDRRFHEIVNYDWKLANGIKVRCKPIMGLTEKSGPGQRSKIRDLPATRAAGLIIDPPAKPYTAKLEPPKDPKERELWERERSVRGWRSEYRKMRLAWKAVGVVI